MPHGLNKLPAPNSFVNRVVAGICAAGEAAIINDFHEARIKLPLFAYNPSEDSSSEGQLDDEQDTGLDILQQLAMTRPAPSEVLVVTPNGIVCRDMTEAQMYLIGKQVQCLVEDAPSEKQYYRDERWMRLARDQSEEKVYYYKTDNDAECQCSTEYLYEALENDYEYEMLGNGNYSSVLVCPWDETKVIKVGYGSDGNGDIWEDGWLSWAAFCMYMQRTGNHPNLPRIHHIVFLDNVFVAIMERYDDTWNRVDYVEYTSLGQMRCIQESYASLRSVIGRNWDSTKLGSAIPSMVSEMNLWYEHELRPSIGDTHGGNIMVDLKNNCVVLTDPTSNDYSLGDRREQIFKALGLIP